MGWMDDPLKWAVDSLDNHKKHAHYEKYEHYYEGHQPLAFATPKYAQTFGTLFRAFAYNRCAGVVDAHADRLQVLGIRSMDESITEAARLIWEHNRMDKRAGEIHRHALLCGDSYLIVWPEAGTNEPQLWPQEAENIRVVYDEDRPGLIVLAAKGWRIEDDRMRINLYYPDRIEKWVSVRPIERYNKTDVQFVPWEVAGEPWPVPNPWMEVPIFHFANNADTGAYGRSELCDVVPLQDALNKVLTDLLLASELGGFPQKVILGLDADDEQVREGLRRLEAGMNKIFSIPFDGDGKAPSIAEFSATNLEQMREVVQLFDTLISRVSRVPVHYLQMTGNFPSGRALRTAEGPFVAKIEDRQRAFGNVWEDAMSLALRMAGMADPGPLDAVWETATALMDEDKWDLAILKGSAGLPLAQILREMGDYEEDEIDKIMQDQQDSQLAFDQNITGVMANEGKSPSV